MTMEATPGWALPLLFAGQAQKEIFHNEALMRADMLLHPLALSADLSSPPASPAIGACWIVAAGGSGAWEGRDDAIACWTDGGWRFVAPRVGLAVLVIDRAHVMAYDGTAWADGPIRADGIYVAGHKVIGAREPSIASPAGGAAIDTQARATIDLILSALRAHGLIMS